MDNDHIPEEYKQVPYQMIFDVKFYLRKKARLVAGGHRIDTPKADIYSGVVGMESVRTGLYWLPLMDLMYVPLIEGTPSFV